MKAQEIITNIIYGLGIAGAVGLIVVVLISLSYERGYLNACKDFYQGKIKYELTEHTDGTKTWEKVMR